MVNYIPEDMIVGGVHKTNNCGDLEITGYESYDKISVVFLGTGYNTTARSGDIRLGRVRDPLHLSVLGVGYIGNTTTMENGKIKKSYAGWKNMMERCYRKGGIHPTYFGKILVCDEWHCFSTYEKWFDYNYKEGCDVDKDLTVLYSTTYSPSTCSFVPRPINNLLHTPTKHNGLPLGVSWHKQARKYEASCKDHTGKKSFLGLFTCKDVAFLEYKIFKEDTIEKVARKYYETGQISEVVYENLINYKVVPYPHKKKQES